MAKALHGSAQHKKEAKEAKAAPEKETKAQQKAREAAEKNAPDFVPTGEFVHEDGKEPTPAELARMNQDELDEADREKEQVSKEVSEVEQAGAETAEGRPGELIFDKRHEPFEDGDKVVDEWIVTVVKESGDFQDATFSTEVEADSFIQAAKEALRRRQVAWDEKKQDAANQPFPGLVVTTLEEALAQKPADVQHNVVVPTKLPDEVKAIQDAQLAKQMQEDEEARASVNALQDKTAKEIELLLESKNAQDKLIRTNKHELKKDGTLVIQVHNSKEFVTVIPELAPLVQKWLDGRGIGAFRIGDDGLTIVTHGDGKKANFRLDAVGNAIQKVS